MIKTRLGVVDGNSKGPKTQEDLKNSDLQAFQDYKSKPIMGINLDP
jgi:hypothetical protein